MTAPARLASCALLLLLMSPPASAAGDACPDVAPEDTSGRRAMAKEQFAKAEQAEAEGDRQTAVRRYACSLKLVPHPSTAYNLGTTAEKAGDLSMAVEAFKMYLALAPDANDRAAVEARVSRLEAKLADLRSQVPQLPPGGPSANGAAPAATPTPARSPIPPPPPPRAGRRMAGLITLGGAAATLGTGIAFNLVARAKMSDCYDLFPRDATRALSQCDGAKPFAYGSYGLFALSGALGITGITLLLWHPESGPSVAWAPAPGGGALLASGRF